MTLLNFQLVLGRHNIRPPHFASKVSYSASPQTSAKCPRGASCSAVAFLLTLIYLDFAPSHREPLLSPIEYIFHQLIKTICRTV